MNEFQHLADLIRRIQAEGDVGPDDLAAALINEGVRLSAQPQDVNQQEQSDRIAQMVTYASNILRKPGSPLSQAYQAASPETQAAFEKRFRENLENNHYYYLGMQTTGELVRAVGDVPELALAYGRMTPAERSAWVASLRDAWHAFSQAAKAFGVKQA